jgi:hypothetical protein
MVVAVQVLLALTIAAPLHARLRASFDDHVQAAALAGEPDAIARATGFSSGLDGGLWGDFRREEATSLKGLEAALAWLAVVAWAFGAFASGGFLATTRDAAPTTLEPATPTPAEARVGRCARFLAGGGRWFWPMLRMSVVFAVLVFGILGRVVFEAWAPAAAKLEKESASGWAVTTGERMREGAFVFAFLFLRAAADLGRARLVVEGRRSAFLAFLRGMVVLVRRPLRAGGVAIATGLVEMALLLACAALMGLFPGGRVPDLLGAFLTLQAAVYVRWAARAALLGANASLLADLARRRKRKVADAGSTVASLTSPATAGT